MPAAVIGGLLLGVLEAFSSALLTSGLKDGIAFLVLSVVLLLRTVNLRDLRLGSLLRRARMSLGSLVTSHRKDWLGLAGLALFLGTLPLWLNSPYALSTLILIGIYSIVTIGLCLLMGYAGRFSLGQAAFFGLGAYGSAILTVRFAWSPWLALAAAAPITAVIALLFGLPSFGCAAITSPWARWPLGSSSRSRNEWKVYTGGPTGLPGIPRLTLSGVPLKGDVVYYYLVWACALAALALGLNIVNSRFGRALRAIRASEPAAQSLGIAVGRYKLLTFVVSAVYASVAGSLYVHYMNFVSPRAFDFSVVGASGGDGRHRRPRQRMGRAVRCSGGGARNRDPARGAATYHPERIRRAHHHRVRAGAGCHHDFHAAGIDPRRHGDISQACSKLMA